MTKRKNKLKPKKPTWTTAQGDTLLIECMRDGHLLNAHRMLRRERLIGPHVKAILDLEAEIEKRKMQPLPVFLDSVDEAAHVVRRAAAVSSLLRETVEKAIITNDQSIWNGQ